ncbi:hypothetical protein PDESU_02476 [Pontiella desulfatans]|uniref:DUF3604 domain-containing protein n=1 Tax=Pontiella desulfatans TaxID=2750659 RepID=A0A6C2U2A1_PONDE|nr:DUF3604 domain-containing protein [Pontiella desulfatans]VGO13919.1 hypothetical protein PDESU_02476 [Pontiella desulfatans]
MKSEQKSKQPSGEYPACQDLDIPADGGMSEWSRRSFLNIMAATGALTCVPSGLFAAPGGSQPAVSWPEKVEQFPAMACDAAGTAWMAFLSRPKRRGFVRVDRVVNGRHINCSSLDTSRATAIGIPCLTGEASGCTVVFPLEIKDKWQIAFARIDGSGKKSELQMISCEGNANLSPVVASNKGTTWILWESNAGTHRGIYACCVTNGNVGIPQRITAPDANSYNPTIVALPDGRFFAAWDSYREEQSNIYGVWCIDGKWQTEMSLTRDARIERHPHLAVRGTEVWMAWQANSYPKINLNALDEQRVVVARLDSEKLMMPTDMFERVSIPKRHLMRPRIGFDASGALWLSATLGAKKKQAGWTPVLWSYGKDGWSEIIKLSSQEGRWQPVPLAFPKSGKVVASSQYDDLPRTWDDTLGKYRDWKSGIAVKTLPSEEPGRLTLVPLAMPATEFSLPAKSKFCNATFPRQTWKTHSGELSLFFGDLHDHTDISVCDRRFNPPGHDLYANVRDIEQLDFCAITDHGYNFDPQQWSLNAEQTRQNHDPQRFITFLAQEWTSSRGPTSGGHGHRNLIFLDPYQSKFYDSFENKQTPRQVWDDLKDTDFIFIPHQLADGQHKGSGNPPTDWTYTDERLQPVAEIFQGRQSYEYLGCPRQAPHGEPVKGNYLQDAWAKGIVIGVIASPDHGGGTGKAGVWAQDLTRESIFEAIRARHTFGTSHPKMGLQFSAGNAIMGDKVKRPNGPIKFLVKAVAPDAIKEVVIFRNNKIVHRAAPGKAEMVLAWTDQAPLDEKHVWYYTRIQTNDEELAWSSPIWFVA